MKYIEVVIVILQIVILEIGVPYLAQNFDMMIQGMFLNIEI